MAQSCDRTQERWFETVGAIDMSDCAMDYSDSVEARLLRVIEPYVLLAASTLITSAYQRDFSLFGLLSRPVELKAQVVQGGLSFDAPRWLGIDECFLAAPRGRLHSFVKHLPLKRAAKQLGSDQYRHRFELVGDVCDDGEEVTLTYSPWFRYATLPYDFDLSAGIGQYVASAFAHIARAHGIAATCDTSGDTRTLKLAESLTVEVIGGRELAEIAVLMNGSETSLGLLNRQLSVSRLMFPSLHIAARASQQAGEVFERLGVVLDEDQFLLYAGDAGDDVPA